MTTAHHDPLTHSTCVLCHEPLDNGWLVWDASRGGGIHRACARARAETQSTAASWPAWHEMRSLWPRVLGTELADEMSRTGTLTMVLTARWSQADRFDLDNLHAAVRSVRRRLARRR